MRSERMGADARLPRRVTCDFDAPTIYGASPGARNATEALQAFKLAYPAIDLVDSKADKVWRGPIFQPVDGTLDEYLLNTWHNGKAVYDGLFVDSWANTSGVSISSSGCEASASSALHTSSLASNFHRSGSQQPLLWLMRLLLL